MNQNNSREVDIENELAYALTVNEQGSYEKNLETTRLYLSAYKKVIEETHHQELQKAREEERAIWAQRLPEDTFSVTIEGRFDKRIVANRKFVSMKSISATGGRTLLLEAEACAHQILQSLNQSELDQPTV